MMNQYEKRIYVVIGERKIKRVMIDEGGKNRILVGKGGIKRRIITHYNL
jgi:hypothetical protein